MSSIDLPPWIRTQLSMVADASALRQQVVVEAPSFQEEVATRANGLSSQDRHKRQKAQHETSFPRKQTKVHIQFISMIRQQIAILASYRYPWTVIRVEARTEYLNALDRASVDLDVRPFADFIAERVRWSLKKTKRPRKHRRIRMDV
jgi:hypothetical protein